VQTDLQRDSTADQCAAALRQAILEGEFGPGDKLPPERKLAETFGVNRVTVRSALRSLEADQLVSVRQGRGYAVHDFLQVGGPRLISSLIDLAVSPDALCRIVTDLLMVRRHLAQAVFERLAMLGDDVDLLDTERAIDRLERLSTDDTCDAETFAEADLDVIAALVRATQSPVLRLCFNPVSQVLRRLPQLQQAMFRTPTLNVAAHRLVFGWLDDGRADVAAAVAQELARADARTLAALRALLDDKETR